ncbi:hypothetical protein BST95_00535 [Halioglobus japonicus]|uniref:ATP-binding protein n=1 Tax=Halioglobus japonicus TaxID=930805 RepID=UPI0009797D99|nr:sensor histidine kinase [Halioglobus japonicus]AQA16933.1 hypothetical protein BST95_00535 [Halioglobus japonicus]GHD21551.1 hypothetical protein GCM10007052_32470 [Halioglobus japonicus]
MQANTANDTQTYPAESIPAGPYDPRAFRELSPRAAPPAKSDSEHLRQGAVHDLNNLLHIAFTNLFLLVQEQDKNTQRANEEIGDALCALQDAITNLTRLSSKNDNGEDLISVARVNYSMNVVYGWTHRTVFQGRVSYSEPEQGLYATVNAHFLESAILNLCLNARSAVKGKHDGGIRLILEQASVGRGEELAPGNYVKITVSDNGVGMGSEQIRCLLQPGSCECRLCDSRDQDGRGLGLKMVQRFASDAGGGVRIVSTPGKGTDVTILLPAAAGPQAR